MRARGTTANQRSNDGCAGGRIVCRCLRPAPAAPYADPMSDAPSSAPFVLPAGDAGVRLTAPAAARNRDPILAVLRRVLPPRGVVLEIASGTGEHVAHFAGALPHLVFQPTDPSPAGRASIAAWIVHEGLGNVRPPLDLDAAADWPVTAADAIICINMIHIAPWTAAEGLMRGAGAVLPAGGMLVLYGPFVREGVPTAPSNLAFDAQLKAQDPRWGLRRLEDVTALAAAAGLDPDRVEEMPANNLAVVFRRSGRPSAEP